MRSIWYRLPLVFKPLSDFDRKRTWHISALLLARFVIRRLNLPLDFSMRKACFVNCPLRLTFGSSETTQDAMLWRYSAFGMLEWEIKPP